MTPPRRQQKEVSMADIGKEKKIIEVLPTEEPAPTQEPAPAPSREPEREREPEQAPA